MSRRIFVGDVQACRAELERLLEAVRFDPAADRLQPVGDLVQLVEAGASLTTTRRTPAAGRATPGGAGAGRDVIWP